MKACKNLIGAIWIPVVVLFLAGCGTSSPLDALTEWDLVYISDSSGWGVAEKLAENIQRDTGKTVRVHDYTGNELPALRVLAALQTDPDSLTDLKFRSFQADVAEAEVIIFFANPRGDPAKGGIQGGVERCISSLPDRPPEVCTLQLYEPYIANLKTIYTGILELRNGEPTILRAVDFYNPLISRQRECNIGNECIDCLETFNAAVAQAADAFGVPLISVHDAFNGIEHDEDPREKGYIGKDGIHTSEQGQQVIADLISQAGYKPVQP